MSDCEPERPVLLALPPLPREALVGMLADVDAEIVVPSERTQAAVRDMVGQVDLVLGDWTHQLGLREPEVALVAQGRLAFVQQPSVGIDCHDPTALAAAGVALANTAGANATAVAEWCVGATLSVLRSMVWGDQQVRAGRWPQLELASRGSTELAGRRVGVLGFGNIGRRCAELYAGFGCEVSYHSRTPRPDASAVYRELPDLLATSDVLVVVVPLTSATRGLLDAAALDRLPAGAVLVDAARGGIVDEDELAARCADGRLLGAAMDVFATEPLPAQSPLRSSERVLLSPHGAGTSRQGAAAVLNRSVENLRRVCAGEQPTDVLNGVSGVRLRPPGHQRPL